MMSTAEPMLCSRQSSRSSNMLNAMVSSHTRIAYSATLRLGQGFLNAFLQTLACIYLDGCFFRYHTYNFFKESLNEKHVYVKCSLPTKVSKDVHMGKEFQEKVFIENVTDFAMLNKGFALSRERKGLEAIHAMAQCWMTDCLALLHVSLLFYCLVSLISFCYFIDPCVKKLLFY